MANEITFKVKLTDDGGLKVVAKEAEKASKATDKLGQSTSKLNKARNRHQKIEKGLGQAGLSGAKGFSKQAGAITGGLVPAYAVLAANIFAITAAFTALKNAAQVQVLEEGFARLGNTVGRTSDLMASRLKDITDGAISTEQALRTAASGFSAGFSIGEMEGLAKIAKGASIALGRDLGDALDRLIRGTAKLEPEILDELGIFIKIEDAAAKYAAQLGIVPSALTEVQKRQAFLNEALDQGAKKFSDVGEVDVNPFDKLAASFKELAEGFLQILNIGVIPFIEFLSQNITALVGVMILFGTSVAKHMIPALQNIGQGTIDAAKKAKEAIPGMKEATRAAVAAEEAAIGSAKVKVGKNSIFAQLQGKVASGKGSPDDIKKSIKSLNASVLKREAHAKKVGVTVSAEYQKETAEIKALIAHYQQLERLRTGSTTQQGKDLFITELGAAEEALGESMAKIQNVGAVDGFKEASKGLKEYKGKILDTNKSVNKLTKPGRFGKMGNAIKAGFQIASGGVRLFGAALINAIPVIGQIIFAVGLLIQGFQWLFSRAKDVMGPMSELDTIADTASEKFEQLEEKISKSRAKLNEFGKESEKAAQRGRHLKAEYAVLNGVVGETADAFGRFSNALGAEKMGIFDRFVVSMKELGGNIVKGVVDTINSIGSGIKALFDLIAGTKLGEWFGVVATGASEVASSAATTLGDFVTGGTEAEHKFSNLSQQFSKNINAILDADTTGLAEKIYGDAMGENADGTTRSVHEFVEAVREATDGGKNYAKAQEMMNGVMKKAKDRTAALEAATTGLGKQLVEAGQKSSEFFASLTSKDKFEEFQGTIINLQTNINESQAALAGMAGEGASLRAIFDDNNQIFKQFGITFEEFKDQGGKAFDPIVQGAQRVIDATRNTKNEVAALKEGLKQLKIEDKLRKTERTATQMMKSFTAYGKMEVGLVDAAKNIAEDKKLADEMAMKERDMKQTIIAMEHELLIAKIDFQMLAVDVGSKEYENLQNQKDIITQMTGMKLETARKEFELALATNKLTETTASGAARNKNLQATTTGTVQERLQGLSALGAQEPSKDKLDRKNFKTDEEFKGAQGAADIQDMRDRVQGMKGVLGPMMEDLKKLGPEGEVVAAVTQGAFVMADSWMNVGQTFKNTTSKMERGAAIAGAIAQTVQQIGQIMAAASQARIAAVDKEIAAEKKRDGKSKESVAKIKALEKKKDQMQRKAFEQQKKIQMISIIANTAMSAMAAMAPPPVGLGPLTGGFLAAAMIAMGAAQLAIVAGTSYQGGASSIEGSGPTSVSVGKRKESTDLAKSKSAAGEQAYFRGDKGIGGPENFRAAFYGKKHRAYGGNAGYIVGEQGPELFMPDRPGTIVPADDTAEMGAASNVVFNINTIDASGVEEMLESQQGNIIGMLRSAANSYGEDFMESVDETSMISPTTPSYGGPQGSAHRRKR